MTKELNQYKTFIDTFAKSKCVKAQWILQNRPWPDTSDENKAINTFIASLSQSQKQILSSLTETAYSSGIHDTLARINEMYLDSLEITINGLKIPEEPFDTGLHYDYVCRREGDEWPDEKT